MRALVESGMVQQQRCLDLGSLACARLPTVEGHRRRKIRKAHGHDVDDGSAEAESDRSDAAVALRSRLEKRHRGEQVLGALGRIVSWTTTTPASVPAAFAGRAKYPRIAPDP